MSKYSFISYSAVIAVILLSVSSCSNKKNQKLQEISKAEDRLKNNQSNQDKKTTNSGSTPSTGVSSEEKLKAIELELEKIKTEKEELVNQLHALNTAKDPVVTEVEDEVALPEVCTLYLFTAHQMLRDSVLPREMLEKLLNDVVIKLKTIVDANNADYQINNHTVVLGFNFHLDIALPFQKDLEDQEVSVKVNPNTHTLEVELQSGVKMIWEPSAKDSTPVSVRSLRLVLAALTKPNLKRKLVIQLTDRQRAELIFLSNIKKDLFGEEKSKLRLDDQFLLPTVYDTVINSNYEIQLGSSSVKIDDASPTLNFMEHEWINYYVKDGDRSKKIMMNIEKLIEADTFRINYIAYLTMPKQCQNIELTGIELPASAEDKEKTEETAPMNLFAQEAQTLQKMASAAQEDSFLSVFESFLNNPRKQ